MNTKNNWIFDVVVVGATPGGIATAVAAARMGRSVLLTEHNEHVGGMTTSGLGKSDIENRDMVGGLFREFVERVHSIYQERYAPDSHDYALCREGYYCEPSVAESVFLQMIGDAGRIRLINGYDPVEAIKEGNKLIGGGGFLACRSAMIPAGYRSH